MLDITVKTSRQEALISYKFKPKITFPGEGENREAQGCLQVQNSLLISLFTMFFHSFFFSL